MPGKLPNLTFHTPKTKHQSKSTQHVTLRPYSGFTLIEMLVVIAMIGVLASVVLVIINPPIQIARAHNAVRNTDVYNIGQALYTYEADNGGQSIPSTIPSSETCGTNSGQEICKTGASSCSGLVDLSVLTQNQKYIAQLPNDPTGSSQNGTGYFIAQNSNGHVLICAPHAQNGVTISIIR